MKGLKVLVSVLLVLALLSFLVGCTGPEGLMGPKGEQGVQGPVGSQGIQGEPGPQGEPGAGGVKGSTGATGATGSTGATGEQGIQGERGPTGAGASGPKGSTGATGSKGDKGDPGDDADCGNLQAQIADLEAGVTNRAIRGAATRLLTTQNSDGGWEWLNPDTDPESGTSAVNTIGVTAQGMLDAYKLIQGQYYLEACIDAYDLVAANVIGDSTHRIKGPDIPFLVELSEVTDVSDYADFAKLRYDKALVDYGSSTATGFAQYVRDGRESQGYPELISWDINLILQGVLALDRYFPGQGYDAQADAMAEVIYESLYVPGGYFDINNASQPYYCLAVTGALEAFVTTGVHAAEVTTLTASLLGLQQPDGSFIDGSDGDFLQPTAYAIMALVEVGADEAIADAVNYLVGCQELNGGWLGSGGGEYTEVGSEAIQAIYDFIK